MVRGAGPPLWQQVCNILRICGTVVCCSTGAPFFAFWNQTDTQIQCHRVKFPILEENFMENKTFKQTAMFVSYVSIVGNVILSGFKLFAGIVAHSGAMISDAVHSASDVFSTFIVMLGVSFADKESDKEHPYGHERMECVAAIVLAGILAATGIAIGMSGLKNIFSGNQNDLAMPGMLALVAAVISIVSKEAMYQYTKVYAKKINSGALMADAWHHRSDALSSVGSFVGILGARLGFPVLDSVASVVICLFILKASFDIFMDAINKMTDTACDDQTVEQICEVAKGCPGVLGVDQVKTRLFGDKIYVDVEICADGSLSLHEAHKIAEEVHDAIESSVFKTKHCMVHVNPA